MTELLENFSTEEPFVLKIKELRKEQLKEENKEKKRDPLLLGAIILLLVTAYLAITSLVPVVTNMIPPEWEKKIVSIAYKAYLSDKKRFFYRQLRKPFPE